MKRPVASSKTSARFIFLLKSKSKVSSVLPGSRKRACVAAALEEPILPPDELVADERGDEVERRQPLGLRLAEAGFEDVGHAGEAELAQRAVEFGEGHSGVSLSVRRSMRSR